MISLSRASFQDEKRYPEYVGLYTDGFPTMEDPAMCNGAEIYFIDTQTRYKYDLDNDIWYEVPTASGTDTKTGVLVGIVDQNDSMPTTRQDGSALENEDYVKPKPSADFPFTINGVTFPNKFSKAIWFNGQWMMDAGLIQDTAETPLATPDTEKWEIERVNQQQLNLDIINQLKNEIIEYTNLNDVPADKLYKRIYKQTTDTADREAGIYYYNFNSTETDKWETLGGGSIKAGNVLPSGKRDGELFILLSDVGTGNTKVKKGLYRFNGNLWVHIAHTEPWTDEIEVKDTDTESISKTATTQQEINQENALIIGQEKEIDVDEEVDLIGAVNWLNDNKVTKKRLRIDAENNVIDDDNNIVTIEDIVKFVSEPAYLPYFQVEESIFFFGGVHSGNIFRFVGVAYDYEDIGMKNLVVINYGAFIDVTQHGKATLTKARGEMVSYKISSLHNWEEEEKTKYRYPERVYPTAQAVVDYVDEHTSKLYEIENSIEYGGTMIPKLVKDDIIAIADYLAKGINVTIKDKYNAYYSVIRADHLNDGEYEIEHEYYDGKSIVWTYMTDGDAITYKMNEPILVDKEYDALETVNKTVIGAINELNSIETYQFKGYVSKTAPTGTIKDGELWYLGEEMPTEFPIAAKEYKNGAWSALVTQYTPTSLDLWANLENDHGYYWFGNHWNLVDIDIEVDDETIDLNEAGQIRIKDEGIKFIKLNDELVSTEIPVEDGDAEKIPTEKAVEEAFNKTYVASVDEIKNLDIDKYQDKAIIICQEDATMYQLSKEDDPTEELGKWKALEIYDFHGDPMFAHNLRFGIKSDAVEDTKPEIYQTVGVTIINAIPDEFTPETFVDWVKIHYAEQDGSAKKILPCFGTGGVGDTAGVTTWGMYASGDILHINVMMDGKGELEDRIAYLTEDSVAFSDLCFKIINTLRATVDVDNTTIDYNIDGELEVMDEGITNKQINPELKAIDILEDDDDQLATEGAVYGELVKETTFELDETGDKDKLTLKVTNNNDQDIIDKEIEFDKVIIKVSAFPTENVNFSHFYLLTEDTDDYDAGLYYAVQDGDNIVWTKAGANEGIIYVDALPETDIDTQVFYYLKAKVDDFEAGLYYAVLKDDGTYKWHYLEESGIVAVEDEDTGIITFENGSATPYEAIIPVDELPTTNVQTGFFYRLKANVGDYKAGIYHAVKNSDGTYTWYTDYEAIITVDTLPTTNIHTGSFYRLKADVGDYKAGMYYAIKNDDGTYTWVQDGASITDQIKIVKYFKNYDSQTATDGLNPGAYKTFEISIGLEGYEPVAILNPRSAQSIYNDKTKDTDQMNNASEIVVGNVKFKENDTSKVIGAFVNMTPKNVVVHYMDIAFDVMYFKKA